MKSLDSSPDRKQRHVVVGAIAILTAASAVVTLPVSPTPCENSPLANIVRTTFVPTQQAAPADVQTPTGVRLTIADHERITRQIQAENGITISDWVWENYSEGVAQLEAAQAAFYAWNQTLPRDFIHGERSADDPYSLYETQSVLLKSSAGHFDAGMLGLERQYWKGLSLHQIPDELMQELQGAVYRRYLLPKNTGVPGANVDVVELLARTSYDPAGDNELDVRIAGITRAYGHDMMELLLEQAKRVDSARVDAMTIFDFQHRGRQPPTIGKIQRDARKLEIQGQIAARNATSIGQLRQSLPEPMGMELWSVWRSAVYPFLWDASLESRLARIDQASSRSLQALSQEIREYQWAMHQELWKAQTVAWSYEREVAARRENPSADGWSNYRTLRNQCVEQIKQYIAKHDELTANGGRPQ